MPVLREGVEVVGEPGVPQEGVQGGEAISVQRVKQRLCLVHGHSRQYEGRAQDLGAEGQALRGDKGQQEEAATDTTTSNTGGRGPPRHSICTSTSGESSRSTRISS